MESSFKNPKIREINLDKQIPYSKEKSKLLILVESFKESFPELYVIKDRILAISMIVGFLFLLVNKFSHLNF